MPSSQKLNALTEAIAKGMVAASDYAPGKRSWNTKVNWAIEYVIRENAVRVLRQWLDMELILVQLLPPRSDALTAKFELIIELKRLHAQLLLPSLVVDDDSASKTMEKVTSLWEDVYGKRGDPETEKRIQRTIDHLANRKPSSL